MPNCLLFILCKSFLWIESNELGPYFSVNGFGSFNLFTDRQMDVDILDSSGLEEDVTNYEIDVNNQFK